MTMTNKRTAEIEALLADVLDYQAGRREAERRDAERTRIIGDEKTAFLGLSPSALRSYRKQNVIKSLRSGFDKNPLGGLEHECHVELAKRFDVPLGYIAIPLDVLEYRSPRPNYLVGVSAPAGMSFIDMLRNRSICFQLGIQRIPDLRDDVAVPRQTANTSVAWLGPGGSVTPSDSAFGQVSATVRTAVIITEVSEQLLRQSAAEQIISNGLAADLAVGIDQAVIQGIGGAQPLGILNLPGIGTASGTSLGYAGLVGVQKTVADANAIIDGQSLGYATTPAISELLKGRQRFTGTDSPLWRGALHDGEIEGVRAVASKQVPSATLVYGDWSTIALAEWGPLMLAADNGGTRFNQALVGIRAMWMVDVIASAPTAFVKMAGIT